jgi:hypothetical protein
MFACGLHMYAAAWPKRTSAARSIASRRLRSARRSSADSLAKEYTIGLPDSIVARVATAARRARFHVWPAVVIETNPLSTKFDDQPCRQDRLWRRLLGPEPSLQRSQPSQ